MEALPALDPEVAQDADDRLALDELGDGRHAGIGVWRLGREDQAMWADPLLAG